MLRDITVHTAADFTAIFLLGMQLSVGAELSLENTMQGWPDEYRQAFLIQTDIGWNQVLLGRLAEHWDQLASYTPSPGSETRPRAWVNNVVRHLLKFGLEMWSIRNQLVHGTVGGISLLKRDKVRRLISLMFQELKPNITNRAHEVFDRSEEAVHKSSFQCQMAWLGRLKFLYPDQYKDILLHMGDIDDTLSPQDVLAIQTMGDHLEIGTGHTGESFISQG